MSARELNHGEPVFLYIRISVFGVLQLINEKVPKVESFVCLLVNVGHYCGGVVIVQVFYCCPSGEPVPPQFFHSTLLLVVEQVADVDG